MVYGFDLTAIIQYDMVILILISLSENNETKTNLKNVSVRKIRNAKIVMLMEIGGVRTH